MNDTTKPAKGKAPKAPKTTKPAKPAKPAKVPAKAKAPKPRESVLREKQNGQTRPAPGSKTGITWDIADKLSAKAGGPAKRADVLKAAEEAGVNPATAATQFGRWRRFHGLMGRS